MPTGGFPQKVGGKKRSSKGIHRRIDVLFSLQEPSYAAFHEHKTHCRQVQASTLVLLQSLSEEMFHPVGICTDWFIKMSNIQTEWLQQYRWRRWLNC